MTDRHSTKSYPVRMTPEMREHLQEAADANKRSLHAEIISRLEYTIGKERFHSLSEVIGPDVNDDDKSDIAEILRKDRKDFMEELKQVMEGFRSHEK